jgi:3-methyladenine DNA glycosylase AlkD
MQNGDVSRLLQKMGISYRLNYGVSIPHLRQIGSEYLPNNELAFLLMKRDIREAKIISSMLFEVEKLTKGQILEIASQLNNQELIEQFSKNMLSHAPNLPELLDTWLSKSLKESTLAFYTASWAIKQNHPAKDEILSWVTNTFQLAAVTDNPQLNQAILFAMQTVYQTNEQYQQKMKDLAEKMMHTENNSVRSLGQEFLWLNAT